MRNSDKPETKKGPLSERIEKACKDIIYLSETDAPVEPFFGEKIGILNRKTILEAIGKSELTQVEEIQAEKFFERVTKINDWYTESQKKNAERFAALRKLLEMSLQDLRVFRLGSIQIDIYIVGTDAEGNLAGVTTRSVET